eukprot:403347090
MEFSNSQEDRFKRFLKLLFGFSPLKFIGWYICIAWVIYGEMCYDCIFKEIDGQNAPQHKRGVWITVELAINLVFLVVFILGLACYGAYLLVLRGRNMEKMRYQTQNGVAINDQGSKQKQFAAIDIDDEEYGVEDYESSNANQNNPREN